MNRHTPAPAYARGPNLPLAQAMMGKGGALTHGDRRTKRVRTRSAQRRVAIRDAS